MNGRNTSMRKKKKEERLKRRQVYFGINSKGNE